MPSHRSTLLCVAAVRLRRLPRTEPKTPAQVGRFVRITLPINGQTFERTRRIVRRAMDQAKKEDARLVLIFEFEVPKGQKNSGRGSEFGAAHDLADFLSSEELNAVRTVAYVPQSIQGHAVLVALACQEIVMAKDASIGAAAIDEKTITPTLRSAYTEIANRRRTVPAALALGMLDPAVEVLQVGTEVGNEFVTPEGLAQLKKEHTTKEPVVVKRAGELGEFSGSEARRLSFASYLAADRRELIKALELPPAAVEDDPSLEGGWRPVRVDLKGPIRAESVRQAQHMIEGQIRDRDVNFVCLWIDSPGGSVTDAMQLADFLAFQLDPGKVRTVAYVPHEARSDAAIVALACDQLVMHPRAVLGGSGAYEPSAEEIQAVRQTIRKELAPRKESLLVADGGDDRPASERLPRHPAGRPARRGILLRRRVGRAVGAGQVGKGRADHHARHPAETHRHAGRRVSPGQPSGREFCPVQAVLRLGKRPHAGRAGLGRLSDLRRWPRRAWPCCCW